MTHFLLGAISMACAVAGAMFFRYWLTTKDRLFFWFGLSFVLEALNRVALVLGDFTSDEAPHYYVVRLVSYLMFLWAIIEKNLPRRGGP